jgi:N utilization substance protein B
MGRRRRSRELALLLLYELDLQGEADAGSIATTFWSRHDVDAETRGFAESIVRGTKEHQAKIDELIVRFSERWDLDRIATVDRNILRAGIFELLWLTHVPPKVVINEALEIAKRFSTGDSTRFINGVLDRVRRELSP